MSDDKLAECIETLKQECNYFAHGNCFTARCLKRGGYKSGGINDPNFNNPLCEIKQILAACAEQAKEIEKAEQEIFQLEDDKAKLRADVARWKRALKEQR